MVSEHSIHEKLRTAQTYQQAYNDIEIRDVEEGKIDKKRLSLIVKHNKEYSEMVKNIKKICEKLEDPFFKIKEVFYQEENMDYLSVGY